MGSKTVWFPWVTPWARTNRARLISSESSPSWTPTLPATSSSTVSSTSGPSQQTNLTSCPRNSGGNYPQTRLSTASSGCSLTPGWTQYRGPWTTCPSPLHCTGNQTCNSPPSTAEDHKSTTSSILWLLVLVGPNILLQRQFCWHRLSLAFKSDFFDVLKSELRQQTKNQLCLC